MSTSTGIWNPNTYGAKYDGTTDDHAAIQMTIDACSKAGGGTVTITGNVHNTAPLTLRDGVTLDLAQWSLTGPADPHIQIPTEPGADRMAVRGGYITSTTGDGITLGVAGRASNYRLGWPRITLTGVTVVSCARNGVRTWGSVIETRLIDVVALRSGGTGLHIEGTDSFLLGCTAAAGKGAGILIAGGNSKLTACKAYGNAGHGFWVAGAGRHMLSACEAQDNTRDGFNVGSHWNTLAACLADSNGWWGYDVYGGNNALTGVAAMHGGGGSRQITRAGFRLPGQGNVVSGVSNCPVTVVDDSGLNRRSILAHGIGGHVVD